MPQLTTQLPGLLDRRTEEMFWISAAQAEMIFASIFDLKPTDRLTYQVVGVSGLPNYRPVTEGGDLPQHQIRQVFTKIFTAQELGLEVKISHRLDVGDPALIGDIASRFGFAYLDTVDYKAAALFVGAFSVVNGADGKALCATDHPLGTGASYSNKAATSLDHAAYAAAKSVLFLTPDDEGHPMHLPPTFLVVPSQLDFTAKQVMASAVTSASMQANVNAGLSQVLTWSKLTDAQDWFLASMPLMNGFVVKVAESPSPLIERDRKGAGVSDTSLTMIDFRDWRGVVGSSPT